LSGIIYVINDLKYNIYDIISLISLLWASGNAVYVKNPLRRRNISELHH
jgi:hypothetical protein